MADKTITAPLAIIKYNGVAIGKIKSLRVTENYQRGDVKGIGVLVSTEKPILAITCSFTASSYLIDLRKLGSVDNPFIRRGVDQDLNSYINTILLTDSGVDLYLYKKVSASVENNVVTSTSEELIGIIKQAFLDSQSFDITEGQISGSDLSGSYLEPILL